MRLPVATLPVKTSLSISAFNSAAPADSIANHHLKDIFRHTGFMQQ